MTTQATWWLSNTAKENATYLAKSDAEYSTTTKRLIKIPPTFYRDHKERGLSTPINHSRFKSYVLIDSTDPALPELIADAEYYAENMSNPEWSSATGLARSANVLLQALAVTRSKT